MIAGLADLLILDPLIVDALTPQWVVVPGTEDMKDPAYKSFLKSHAVGHIYGIIGVAVLGLMIPVIALFV